jgi:predicted amidohydrolase YtcJ
MRFLSATDKRGFTRMFTRLAVALLLVFLQAAKSPADDGVLPDIIYVNGQFLIGAMTFLGSEGRFLTGFAVGQRKECRPKDPRRICNNPSFRSQALAIRDGRVVENGTNVRIRSLAGPKTIVVDLGGRFVMPGFNDAHTHLASGGLTKLRVNLEGSKSLEEMKARIAERAKAAGEGEWLTGRGWDHTLWPGAKLPTRQDLDAITGDHPAVFVRVDGHIAIANAAALKAGGIARETPDPPGGKIDRDESGEATGILRETSKDAMLAKVPPPTPAQRRRATELALADAAQWGITSAQDNSEWEDFLVYEQLEREGKLTLRITEWLPFGESLEVLKQRRDSHPHDDLMLHTGMLKGFMDGSLGSRTAAMLAPYSDDPKNTGLPQFEQEKLNQMTKERADAGFQIGFHAIGDRGAEMALEAYAQAGAAGDRRFRIEHDQVITPEQFKKFRNLGVIASMQPNHLLTDMNWAIDRIGPERAKHSYAWKEFLDNYVRLAFGTDYPVEPITPFRGIYAAVTRKNEAGTASYFPEQKLTIDQAIAAYITGSAYAEFAEKDKGTLAPGMLADFVVLDRDITKVLPAEILKTRVLRTVVGGKTVYEAK